MNTIVNQQQLIEEQQREIERLRERISQLSSESDGWKDCAKHHAEGQGYYRNLVIDIGELFGEEAKTSDDGSKQDSVLTAKVPELVCQLAAQNNALRSVVKETLQIAEQTDCFGGHREWSSNHERCLNVALEMSPAASLAEIQAQAIEDMALRFAKDGLPDENWSKSIQLYANQIRQQVQDSN